MDHLVGRVSLVEVHASRDEADQKTAQVKRENLTAVTGDRRGYETTQ